MKSSFKDPSEHRSSNGSVASDSSEGDLRIGFGTGWKGQNGRSSTTSYAREVEVLSINFEVGDGIWQHATVAVAD